MSLKSAFELEGFRTFWALKWQWFNIGYYIRWRRWFYLDLGSCGTHFRNINSIHHHIKEKGLMQGIEVFTCTFKQQEIVEDIPNLKPVGFVHVRVMQWDNAQRLAKSFVGKQTNGEEASIDGQRLQRGCYYCWTNASCGACRAQRAEAILDKISNIMNKIHTRLISVLQGFLKRIARNPSN